MSEPTQDKCVFCGQPSTSVWYADDNQKYGLCDDHGDHHGLFYEAIKLHQWRAQTEPLLRALTKRGATALSCIGCHMRGTLVAVDITEWGITEKRATHTPDCPVIAARALLGEGGEE